MKTLCKSVAVSGLILVGVAGACQAARVHAWIRIDPFPVVVAAPAVVEQPVVEHRVLVPDPDAAPPVDYRQMLLDFHKRVERLQKVLDRQLNRGIISQIAYDRHAADLDRIIQDEHQDAAMHHGALTPREVHELNGRLTALQDRLHEDLAR